MDSRNNNLEERVLNLENQIGYLHSNQSTFQSSINRLKASQNNIFLAFKKLIYICFELAEIFKDSRYISATDFNGRQQALEQLEKFIKNSRSFDNESNP